MPSHHWGDEDFDWNALWESVNYCMDFWRRWGRIGSHGKEKYGCYDADTKVLTEEGWKYFKETDVRRDRFATLQDQGIVEFKYATGAVRTQHNGDMYHIRTRGIDLLVTPDHNLYCAPASQHETQELPSLQTYHKLFRKPKRFFKGGSWIGKSPATFVLPEYTKGNKGDPVHKAKILPLIPWLQLLGWVVAEGSISNYQLDICLNGTDNGEEANHVRNIITETGFEFVEKSVTSSTILRIYSVQLCQWLIEHVRKLAPNKKVPSFIKELSPNLIEVFLKELYEGDGHKTQTAFQLSTSSVTLAEDCLELLLKSGYCGSMYLREPRQNKLREGRILQGHYPEYIVNWLRMTEHISSNSHDSISTLAIKERIVPYSGMIYCVEVPGHKLYVMRNGKPVWCGNTFRDHASFWDGSIWHLCRPSAIWYGEPPWTWIHGKIDRYFFMGFTKWTGIRRLFRWWQRQVYNYAIQKMCKKHPHIINEIVSNLDGYRMVKPGLFGNVDGTAIHSRFWRIVE